MTTSDEHRRSFTFYGGAAEFVKYKGPEALIHGPAETGKSISCLWFLHLCAIKYPNASIVIMRKTLTSAYSSVLQTFTNKVLGPRDSWPCEPYGGEKPEWFNYQNGSRIWIAGMDKASRVLSSEHDLIFWNQAEEATLEEWEICTTRTTGRAGNMPYSQTIGDCNPAFPSHWMYHRPSLRMFYSTHQENPTLYDPVTGEITEQGKHTMQVLESLTGLRRTRLLEGKAAQAEGVIYETWDEAVHLIYSDAVPVELNRFVAGQDWGFTHPGVLTVWGQDWDGAMYLVAQVYHTKQLSDWWTERAVELAQEFNIEVFACGPDQPAYIEQYRQAGLNAKPAFNSVLPGIDAVQKRLKDNRLFIVRDSLRYPDQALITERKPYAVEHEFAGYTWSNSLTREQPVKQYDDGLESLRYAVAYVDNLDQERRPLGVPGLRPMIGISLPRGDDKFFSLSSGKRPHVMR